MRVNTLRIKDDCLRWLIAVHDIRQPQRFNWKWSHGISVKTPLKGRRPKKLTFHECAVLDDVFLESALAINELLETPLAASSSRVVPLPFTAHRVPSSGSNGETIHIGVTGFNEPVAVIRRPCGS